MSKIQKTRRLVEHALDPVQTPHCHLPSHHIHLNLPPTQRQLLTMCVNTFIPFNMQKICSINEEIKSNLVALKM